MASKEQGPWGGRGHRGKLAGGEKTRGRRAAAQPGLCGQGWKGGVWRSACYPLTSTPACLSHLLVLDSRFLRGSISPPSPRQQIVWVCLTEGWAVLWGPSGRALQGQDGTWLPLHPPSCQCQEQPGRSSLQDPACSAVPPLPKGRSCCLGDSLYIPGTQVCSPGSPSFGPPLMKQLCFLCWFPVSTL